MAKKWLIAVLTALTAVICVSGARVAPTNALSTPLGPVSLGTATVEVDEFGDRIITLNGSIAVGTGEFQGQATGTVTDDCCIFFRSNIIAPFSLEGPGLQGTCSGHWVVPMGTVDPAFRQVWIPYPVVEASLSCNLQLGDAPPAETGLSVVAVETEPSSFEYTGLFGPGPSSLAVPAPASLGTYDVTSTYSGVCELHYSLVGDIALGGRVFHGNAVGDAMCGTGEPEVVALTGISPSGNLSATCTEGVLVDLRNVDSLLAFVSTLTCTGRVGDGPTGATTLVKQGVLPTYHSDPSPTESSSDRSGVFVGV